MLEKVGDIRSRLEPIPLSRDSALIVLDMQSHFLDPSSHAFIPSAPHYDHVIVFTYQTGETANAIGRNADGSWLAVADPDGDENEVWCWVPDEYIERELDVFILPKREHLPSTGQLMPDEEAEGCWWDDPLDNNSKVCKVPCPNDAFSGGLCNP